MGSHGIAHQLHVRYGGACTGKTGRRFHKVRADFLGQLAGIHNFRRRQQRRFQNHFECNIADRRAHLANFFRHHIPRAVFHSTDILHHIDFGRALRQRPARFRRFHRTAVRAVRKTDDRRHADAAAGKRLRRLSHAIRRDANGGEMIRLGFFTKRFDSAGTRVGR